MASTRICGVGRAVRRGPHALWLVALAAVAVGCHGGRRVQWDGLGFRLETGALDHDEVARIAGVFMPAPDATMGAQFTAPETADANLITYEGRGRILTIASPWVPPSWCTRSIMVERPDAMPLRHKIMVGTDYRKRKIVWRAPLSEPGAAFERAYVLRREAGGEVLGLVFHEGAFVEIKCPAPTTEAHLREVERLAHATVHQLKQFYERDLSIIAHDLDDGRPLPTRPDLPDPDLSAPTE